MSSMTESMRTRRNRRGGPLMSNVDFLAWVCLFDFLVQSIDASGNLVVLDDAAFKAMMRKGRGTAAQV